MREPDAPDPLDENGYQGALRALVDRVWLRSRSYKDQLGLIDVSCVDSELVDFAMRLLRRGKKMGIPLDVQVVQADLVRIVHARRGDLPPKSWEILAHLGNEIARQYGLHVRWHGAMSPSFWRSRWIPEPPPKPSVD